MSTMFESSFSTSAMRPHHNTSDTTSMADSLPTVNFGFEDLRERMARFTARFDDFIEKGRKRVLEERNQFRMNVAELQDDAHHLELTLQSTHQAQKMHTQTLGKERTETTDLHSAIAQLKDHKANLQTQRDTLQSDLTQIQTTVHARKEAQAANARYLASQARHNGPELAFWEERLGMRIQLGECPMTSADGQETGMGGKEDQIRFTFTSVSERDWMREAWVEMDVSSREYGVVGTEPVIEAAEVQGPLERLNETRELVPFLTEMRDLLVKALK